MNIQQYLDSYKKENESIKLEIIKAIQSYATPVHESVPERDKYGVIFEGFAVARYMPWLPAANYYNTALSPDRLYMIKQFLEMAPEGKCVECGVYTGGVTRMMLDAYRDVIAFDTFEGIKGAGEFDLHQDGDYDAGDVTKYIQGAEIVRGEIPYTFNGRDDTDIAFVHLDMDIYEPTRAALAYFYPRMREGGIIVLDDYGFWTTPGIKKAVDEFHFAKKIYLPTGQMVIFR